MKKTIISILIGVIGLSALTYAALYAYMLHSGFTMSVHGHVAVGLGIFFTYGVGAGLMALLFFSNKYGHDDTVHKYGQDKTNTDTTPED